MAARGINTRIRKDNTVPTPDLSVRQFTHLADRPQGSGLRWIAANRSETLLLNHGRFVRTYRLYRPVQFGLCEMSSLQRQAGARVTKPTRFHCRISQRMLGSDWSLTFGSGREPDGPATPKGHSVIEVSLL